MKSIAVVVPIYSKTLSKSEILSLRKLDSVLGSYAIFVMVPTGFETQFLLSYLSNFTVVEFAPKYFKDVNAYSTLTLSPFFYKQFIAFDFLLIYQTDAYVFRDELQAWCEKGFDYVGAPWLERPPLVNGKPIIDIQNCFIHRVGNGGFSLRKVRTFYWNTIFFRPILWFLRKNEDMFWGLFIDYLNPFFKKPSWQEALSFAFEMNPKKAFELNNNQLPFGVHAWEKYDKEFWEGKVV